MSPLGCEGELGFSGADRQDVVGISWPFCAGHGFRKPIPTMAESGATAVRPLGMVKSASFCGQITALNARRQAPRALRSGPRTLACIFYSKETSLMPDRYASTGALAVPLRT